MDEAKSIIQELLIHLPDSKRGEDWEWCWNELYPESQDDVKRVVERATKFLERK